MKKYILLTLLFVISIFADAQGIYTSVTKMDKFDDVVSKRVVKTLITKTDSTITIETKGLKPVTYYITEDASEYIGSHDKPANLVDDVYGYESHHRALTSGKRQTILAKAKELNIADAIGDSTKTQTIDEFLKFIEKTLVDSPVITFRTISLFHSENVFQYDTDLVWIRYKDGSRTIYKK